MTFREIFEKYQAGTANEEERRLVDEELEKAAIINEHLFGSWEELPAEPPAGELKQVKKSLHKRNLALVLTSVAVVIAMLMSVPLVERCMYFDPRKTTTGDTWGSDLDIALWCYYDLFAPLQDYSRINSYTDTGFGTWSLELQYFDGESPSWFTYLTATVDKNEIRFPRNTLFYASDELFDMGPIQVSLDSPGYDSLFEIEHIYPDVEEDAHVHAAISFNADLNAQELFDLMDTYGIVPSWAAVRVGRPSDPQKPLIGMRLNRHQEEMGINGKYPELMGHVTAYNAEQHFRSMVEYCRDYESEIMNIGIVEDPSYYDKVLTELDENGLRFYGAYVYTSMQTLKELAEAGHMTHLRILEIQESTKYAYLTPSFGG